MHYLLTMGYFHHDLKPRNILMMTTGLLEYATSHSTRRTQERDVVCIVELAGPGDAYETIRTPLYTDTCQ